MEMTMAGLVFMALIGGMGQARFAIGKGDEMKVPMVFSGGHETDPQDGGRSVVLVAAGLG